jgi:hypothetical protein
VIRFDAKLCCLLLWAISCLAQNPAAQPEKAPPDVDEALRTRISKFYQAHVDGKFRAAEAFVAEDSKDAFFEADKVHCLGFQFLSVVYSQSFSRATATVACDTYFQMPMGPPMPVKRPLRTRWKIVDSQWFWYSDPASDKDEANPFGARKPQNPQEPAFPTSPSMAFADFGSVSGQVRADKQQVSFDAAVAGVERVVVTNRLPGSVSLALEFGQLEGLELRLDRTSLGQGESAVLAISYRPVQGRQPAATPVNVVVSPLDQVIPIEIVFRAPAR